MGGRNDAETELCRLLLDGARISSSRTVDVHLEGYLSRNDMSYYLGVHRGSVSRLLASLEKRGIIAREPGNEIVIPHLRALQAIIDEADKASELCD